MKLLPKRVKVGGITYSINKIKMEDFGECHTDPPTINIKAKMKYSLQASTLVHELLHIAYTHAGIQLGDDEERIISGLENVLVPIIADNPDLWYWIIKAFEQEEE